MLNKDGVRDYNSNLFNTREKFVLTNQYDPKIHISEIKITEKTVENKLDEVIIFTPFEFPYTNSNQLKINVKPDSSHNNLNSFKFNGVMIKNTSLEKKELTIQLDNKSFTITDMFFIINNETSYQQLNIIPNVEFEQTIQLYFYEK